MADTRWAGVVVSGDEVRVTILDVPDSGPLILVGDQTCPLQTGDRAGAFAAMHQRIHDLVKTNGVKKVAIKETAAGKNMGLAHLKSAEVRGVVLAAASAGCGNVVQVSKAVLSRSFGERKVDEYLKDDAFFTQHVVGELRRGSREAVFVVVASTRKN